MRENTKLEVREIAHHAAFEVFRAHNVENMTSRLAEPAVARALSERVEATAALLRDRADEEVRKSLAELDLDGRLVAQNRIVEELARRVAAEACDDQRQEVLQLAREEAARAYAEAHPPVFNITLPDATEVRFDETTHEVFPDLLMALRARCHALLVGPAGTGKSMLGKQAAEALDVEFHALSLGPTTPMSKVFGYFDAHGNYHDTPFRRAFEFGGVMLLDELDNGHPGLVGELNQALALGSCAFADGMVDVHPDFHVVATANTYGSGGDRRYVGRQALDAATLDRFLVLDVPVDEALERRLALSHAPSEPEAVEELVSFVQELRDIAESKRLPVEFSPRTSIDGAKLLQVGATFGEVLRWRVIRGLSEAHCHALGLDELAEEV